MHQNGASAITQGRPTAGYPTLTYEAALKGYTQMIHPLGFEIYTVCKFSEILPGGLDFFVSVKARTPVKSEKGALI